MSEAPHVIQWRGRRIEDLTRDELIDVCRQMSAMLQSNMTPEAREARALGEVERMKRGRRRPRPETLAGWPPFRLPTWDSDE